MEKQKISVAIIAKNEADRINTLLKSCTFADEIVVVDSGSTDGTQDLCKKAGAKLLFNTWPGYVAQKQFALEATSSEWILCLDADEEVSAALATEILSAVEKAEADICAFSMPRLSRYLGRWIKHGGWYPDRKVRLIRIGRGVWQGEDPHDELVPNGETRKLTNPILHHVYRGISDQILTINNFSDVYAQQGKFRGGWFVVAGVFHAFEKFVECYLWKSGFLDGIPGLIIAANSAWYVFLKHAKKWELSLPQKEIF
jgi:glycosyltransferase involved in cell wall biosynthesis